MGGTGPWHNRRRWPDLIKPIFFYIRWLLCNACLMNIWHHNALWEEGKLSKNPSVVGMECWTDLECIVTEIRSSHHCHLTISLNFEENQYILVLTVSPLTFQLETKAGKSVTGMSSTDALDPPDLKVALKREREEHQHLLAESYAAVMDLTKQVIPEKIVEWWFCNKGLQEK